MGDTVHGSAGELCAEFFVQGDKERKHGLPVTPILNRSTGHLASSQLAFVMYVTKPMMESLGPVVPKFVGKAISHMEKNMALYQEIIAEGPSSRYKTIGALVLAEQAQSASRTDTEKLTSLPCAGVDYSKLVPPGTFISDNLSVE